MGQKENDNLTKKLLRSLFANCAISTAEIDKSYNKSVGKSVLVKILGAMEKDLLPPESKGNEGFPSSLLSAIQAQQVSCMIQQNTAPPLLHTP